MLFEGSAITVNMLGDGIAEMTFDLKGESVNKFDTRTVTELSQALDALESAEDLKGVLVTSGKGVFIVGADITEFLPLFKQGGDAAAAHLDANVANLNRLEDLSVPVSVAINGFALGGGLEFCLACDYRAMSSAARIGLPETGLGIIPGWGGTVRLPRLIGYEAAAQWIVTGKPAKADAALAAGAVDQVVDGDPREAALAGLKQCIAGEIDVAAGRAKKTGALLSDVAGEQDKLSAMREQIAKKVGPNFPAPLVAVDCIIEGAGQGRDSALALERAGFAKVAATDVAKALVGLFLSDQLISKKARSWEKRAQRELKQSAVLGAGIMGGGIAYQSAFTGTPVIMKDIAQEGLDLGMKEATKLLSKRVSRGQLSQEKMDAILASIDPTLSYDDFGGVDIVVEAVVENPKVKHAVLKDVESRVSDTTVLTSNTSTISITYLAEALERPENFCGMHFFNPVHAMPLVEVIRGEKSSDEAIARTVAYANSLGKKAIVVGDCPGFLVNRTLFPYFAGFAGLLRDGADFQKVDAVMERWGWPMGPAYLLDVIGIDTCNHCEEVMADGFPDRLGKDHKTGADVMFDNGRFGQKNGKGFYSYEADERGRPQKTVVQETYDLLAPHCAERKEFDDEEIIARCMLPMATEMALCLEEGIVETPAEADMALVYGLGFPNFRGGIMRWVDSIGMKKLVEYSDRFKHLGKIYEVTERQREMAAKGESYYE